MPRINNSGSPVKVNTGLSVNLLGQGEIAAASQGASVGAASNSALLDVTTKTVGRLQQALKAKEQRDKAIFDEGEASRAANEYRISADEFYKQKLADPSFNLHTREGVDSLRQEFSTQKNNTLSKFQGSEEARVMLQKMLDNQETNFVMSSNSEHFKRRAHRIQTDRALNLNHIAEEVNLFPGEFMITAAERITMLKEEGVDDPQYFAQIKNVAVTSYLDKLLATNQPDLVMDLLHNQAQNTSEHTFVNGSISQSQRASYTNKALADKTFQDRVAQNSFEENNKVLVQQIAQNINPSDKLPDAKDFKAMYPTRDRKGRPDGVANKKFNEFKKDVEAARIQGNFEAVFQNSTSFKDLEDLINFQTYSATNMLKGDNPRPNDHIFRSIAVNQRKLKAMKVVAEKDPKSLILNNDSYKAILAENKNPLSPEVLTRVLELQSNFVPQSKARLFTNSELEGIARTFKESKSSEEAFTILSRYKSLGGSLASKAGMELASTDSSENINLAIPLILDMNKDKEAMEVSMNLIKNWDRFSNYLKDGGKLYDGHKDFSSLYKAMYEATTASAMFGDQAKIRSYAEIMGPTNMLKMSKYITRATFAEWVDSSIEQDDSTFEDLFEKNLNLFIGSRVHIVDGPQDTELVFPSNIFNEDESELLADTLIDSFEAGAFKSLMAGGDNEDISSEDMVLRNAPGGIGLYKKSDGVVPEKELLDKNGVPIVIDFNKLKNSLGSISGAIASKRIETRESEISYHEQNAEKIAKNIANTFKWFKGFTTTTGNLYAEVAQKIYQRSVPRLVSAMPTIISQKPVQLEAGTPHVPIALDRKARERYKDNSFMHPSVMEEIFDTKHFLNKKVLKDIKISKQSTLEYDNQELGILMNNVDETTGLPDGFTAKFKELETGSVSEAGARYRFNEGDKIKDLVLPQAITDEFMEKELLMKSKGAERKKIVKEFLKTEEGKQLLKDQGFKPETFDYDKQFKEEEMSWGMFQTQYEMMLDHGYNDYIEGSSVDNQLQIFAEEMKDSLHSFFRKGYSEEVSLALATLGWVEGKGKVNNIAKSFKFKLDGVSTNFDTDNLDHDYLMFKNKKFKVAFIEHVFNNSTKSAQKRFNDMFGSNWRSGIVDGSNKNRLSEQAYLNNDKIKLSDYKRISNTRINFVQ